MLFSELYKNMVNRVTFLGFRGAFCPLYATQDIKFGVLQVCDNEILLRSYALQRNIVFQRCFIFRWKFS